MKVLHINTFDTGGAAIGAFRLHKALLEKGVDSKMLILENNVNHINEVYYYKKKSVSLGKRLLKRMRLANSKADLEVARIARRGLPFSEGGTYELFSTPYSNFEDLANHPLVVEADIINLHWISGFVDIPSFFKNIKSPVVWTLHDMQPYLGGFHYSIDLASNPALIKLENDYIKLKKTALTSCKYAIAGNSNWNIDCAKGSGVFKGAKSFETIYYPLDKNEYIPVKKSIAQEALSLQENKIIIGFACEDLNNPRKGFKTLLNALSLLTPSERTKLCCITFGKEIANFHIEGLNIIQFGTIKNPRLQSVVYSAMDFFIIPSIAEAFGLTALEAMACKTPVIGSRSGGIPEMVNQGITGLLFEAGDSESLCSKIREMMGLSPRSLLEWGENAQDLVKSQHTPSLIAEKYMDLYVNLLS